MSSRKRLCAGAVVGATSLLALVCAWRSPSAGRPASAAAPTVELAARPVVAVAKDPPASPASDSPGLDPAASADTAASNPVESTASRRATRTARAHLRRLASKYGLEARDVEALEHRDTYVGGDGGARIVRFRQVVSGRAVLGREVSVVMDAKGKLAGVTGRLEPSIALRRAELAEARAVRSARVAVSAIAGDDVQPLPRRVANAADGFEDFGSARANGPLERARVRRVFFARDGELVPAHQVELDLRADAAGERRASLVVVSAVDGATLHTQSLVHADTYRVYAADPRSGPYDSPTGTSPTPHPTGLPVDYTPPYVESQLVTLSSFPFSRQDPWLPPGASSLSGNTVFAYVDRAAPNGFDPGLDLDVPPTAPGVFDHAYDPSLSPKASDTQSRAAATQLFYVAAYLHDFFYDAGFDEMAGNAQASNFGRGGLGGDRLIVAAQDYALEGRSLAVIPPDGSTPRLSFGIYKGQGGRPDRDGAMDTTLVAHEWGHLLAERIVGDALGLGNAQGRAISEGTADFVALLAIIRPEDINVPGNDDLRGVYAVGGYVASATNDDAYYFGLRRVPYSTDTTRNALSFRHVSRGATLPTTAPMRASDPLENSLPHNAGEVWASALMDGYVSLLRAYPFQEAQDRMKQYLVASLRATPFEPTFGEAAEALVTVASAYDPADAARFAAAFAGRGLGRGAVSPPRTSTDLVGAAESSATQGIRVVSMTLDDSDQTCDADGVLDVGETGRLRVTIENVGRASVGSITAEATLQAASAPLVFPGGKTLTFGSLGAGARATASIPIGLSSAGAGAMADLQLAFSAPVVPSEASARLRVPVHYDEAVSSMTDAMSTRTTTLAFERDGLRVPFVASRDETDEFAHVEDGPARGTRALVTGPLLVTSNLGVSFRMRHSLVVDDGSAPLDGAVVEISEDGIHFEDLTYAGANPSYDGALADAAMNPLGARPAYTGMSAGFPAFVTRSIDLGHAYVGKSVVLRFRIGASGSNRSAYGLDIDDLTVTGVTDAPFAAPVAETSDGLVCNRPPVADAGDDVSVSQLSGDPALGVPSVVTLSATNSFDPDGTPLSFTWTQLSGPAVVLDASSAAVTTFEAPSITKDTMLVFRVAVSDGFDTTADTVRVTVRHDNRAPTAVAKGPDTVAAGAPNVVLDGSLSTDPDGDTLTYEWTQTSGAAVTLATNGTGASFTAPLVDADTKLTFSLVVSDGLATSAPASVDVLVRAATDTDAGAPPPPPPLADAGDDASSAPMPSDDETDETDDDGALVDSDGAGGDDGGGCATGGAHPTQRGVAACALTLGICFAMRRRRRGQVERSS